MYGQNSKFPDYGSMSSSGDMQPRKTSNTSLCNNLADNISCNISTIQSYVTDLERALRDIGTSEDSDILRDEIHEKKEKANQLVGTTTRFIKELRAAVQNGDREQRLRAKRFESEYHSCVERYGILQKKLVPKMRNCPVPLKPKKENLWGVGEESQDNLMDADTVQQQRQIQEELDQEHGLLLEREARIRQIEADILDVNEVFKMLGAEIQEQGEDISRIEENITHVAQNVEAGRENLEKTVGYQNKYRNKMCWLILVVLLICAGIVTWVILANKK